MKQHASTAAPTFYLFREAYEDLRCRESTLLKCVAVNVNCIMAIMEVKETLRKSCKVNHRVWDVMLDSIGMHLFIKEDVYLEFEQWMKSVRDNPLQ